jgi:hypothetical protein
MAGRRRSHKGGGLTAAARGGLRGLALPGVFERRRKRRLAGWREEAEEEAGWWWCGRRDSRGLRAG